MNEKHPFRRGPGRPTASSACQWCGRVEADAIHDETAAAPSRPGLPRFYTVAEVRAQCFPGVTEKSVRDWCRAGKFPGALPPEPGRKTWLIPESALHRFGEVA